MSSEPNINTVNGELVEGTPVSVQIKRLVDDAIVFLILYFTTLFSMDAYASASNSPFSKRNRSHSWDGSARMAPSPDARPNNGYNGAHKMTRFGQLDSGADTAPMPGPGSCKGCGRFGPS